jgi:hypothetical protein
MCRTPYAHPFIIYSFQNSLNCDNYETYTSKEDEYVQVDDFFSSSWCW